MPSPAGWRKTTTARSIEQIKADDYTYRAGRLTIHLAREFGFCYGVDRAVDYAYQTRERFPDRAVYLTGEIIHNPHVNEKLRSMGIGFLSDHDGAIERLGPERCRDSPRLRRDREDAGTARPPRLHAGRHDLRFGAERLEERAPLLRGRLHLDYSRQGVARRNPGHRLPGRRVRRPVSGGVRSRGSAVGVRLRARRRQSATPSSPVSASRHRTASTPTATCAASDSPIKRRC